MRVVEPKCECCGVPTKVFASSGKAKRYCSANCRSHANKDAVKVDLVCVCCGKRFRGERGVATCSRRCQSKVMARKRGFKSRDGMKCGYCGKDFKPKGGQRIGYCSVRCGHDARLKNRYGCLPVPVADGYLWWATNWSKCRECGRSMFTTHGVLCSDECRKEEARKAALVERIEKTCSRCGNTFETTPGFADTKSKCNRCMQRLNGKQFKNNLHRKRARKYGVAYESINRRKLFERDQYKCWICGRTTLKDKKVPHHRAPTIDHVIAMSKGGGHTWANVATACFICNSRKGVRKVKKDRQLSLCVVSA